MTRPLACAMALALMSCTPKQPEPPDSTPGQADVGPVVGTVRVVGSAPVNVKVVVQPASGTSVQLLGPLEEELRRLAGAEVSVRGPVGSAPDPLVDRQMRVESYDILAVDGQPVVAGTVEGRSGEWLLLRTPGGELVYLGGATAQLRPGQKVWVQGPRSVIVQTYGVVKD